jgi:hypothetical protein
MQPSLRSLWALGAPLLLLGLAAVPHPAAAQNVVGTWTLVSETVERGGKTVEPFGANPLGTMMLDASKHFMLMISRPGLPKIGANRRDGGTPEENKEVLAGILAFFGTYTVSESDGLLTVHVEASTFPNWIGSDQKREFTLSGNEMTWTNRTPAVSGEAAKLVWRRQKQAD